MNVAKSFREVRQQYVAHNIPKDLHEEWKEVKQDLGRTSKSFMMESMIDAIEKYRGKVQYDGYTKFDGDVIKRS